MDLSNYFKNIFEEVLPPILSKCLDEKQSKQQQIPNKDSQDELIDIKEASKLLNLKVSTIYVLTSQRRIPHFKQGKKLYFKRNDLQKWIESGRQDSFKNDSFVSIKNSTKKGGNHAQ